MSDKPLTPTQQRVFDAIARNQPVARRELADILGMGKRGVSNHLDFLRSAGRIRHTGLGSTATWSIVQRMPSDIFGAALHGSLGVRP